MNLSLLDASGYDDDILNIYAKIMPRFVLMSSKKKNLKKSINICLVSDTVDELSENILIQKLQNNYPNGIKKYKIQLIKTNYSNIKLCMNSELAFLFNTHDEQINTFVKFSNRYKILTIAYDNKMLKNGVDISLFLGRKIVPFLNMKSISKKNIKLDNMLLRISKLLVKEDG